MVASKFLEISWIRCPQNWRLILGHLSSEKKGDPGWVGLGVTPRKINIEHNHEGLEDHFHF